MRRHWMGVLAFFSWSTAALADAIDDCNGALNDQRIQGCTLLIDAGKLNTRNMARAHYQRAGAYSETGDFDKAIADYTKAIELDPRLKSGYWGRAEAYDKKGDFDAAISDYSKLMEIEPKGVWQINRAGEFKKKGDYDAAIADYTKALEVNPEVLVESSRADAYLQKGDLDHAIADYTTAIERDPSDWLAYNGRAWVYFKAGKAAQALSDAHRSLELSPNDPAALDTRGNILEDLGRREEAIADFQRALAIAPEQEESKDALKRLGALSKSRDELEALYERIVKLDNDKKPPEAIDAAKEYAHATEVRNGKDHINYAFALSILVDLYTAQGRYVDAEPLARQVLDIREKLAVSDQLEVTRSLTALAGVLLGQSKLPEANVLLRRALEIHKKVLQPDHPRVAQSLNNLAVVLFRQGELADSEALERQAIAILEKDPTALGTPGDQLLTALNNLAAILEVQRRQQEAAAVYRRGLIVVQSIEERKRKEADERAAAPMREASILGKGNLFLKCGRNWPSVLATVRGFDKKWQEFPGSAEDRSRDARYDYNNDDPLVRMRMQAAYRMGADQAEFEEEGFILAQRLLLTKAARAISQVGARFGSGTGTLAALIRDQQDLLNRRKAVNKLLHDNYGSAGRISRIEESEEALRASLAKLDKSLSAIETKLNREFPNYAALARPEPLSVTKAQGHLRETEALLLFLDVDEWKTAAPKPPEETFIWVLTKTQSRWVRSDLGTKALTERVDAFRCGLDSNNWTDASEWPDAMEEAKRRKEAQITKRERCKALTGSDIADNEPLPFNIAKANELYQALFGQVEDLLKNPDGTFKQLLIVPSGPLAQLPFQALVTGEPQAAQTANYSNAAWLIRRHAITVLPSVASLEALRQNAKASRATRALIGFGNPLLDGNPEKPWQVTAAHRAREKERCQRAVQLVASALGVGRSVTPLDREKGMSDLAQIRFQAPLPETADELCAVASDLGVSSEEIRLGSRATEREVKALSNNGLLANYRIVQFSTHGALAGEIRGDAEPGLILTPPKTATPEDDGYLSASEITQLKLDADWVILSACNTAAGGAEGASAFSGLASAFFYAGARALLVSHWAVYSDATVKLITKAVSTMVADGSVGRSEALRRSMMALIEKGQPYEAHPAYWAPFVVVGEGEAISSGTSAKSSMVAPVGIETGSADAAKVDMEQQKPQTKPSRRRRPAGQWGWLGELWGE